jgi:hypothetical protein
MQTTRKRSVTNCLKDIHIDIQATRHIVVSKPAIRYFFVGGS